MSNSPEETAIIAQEIAATLKGGEVIALEGDLGAGKTTFTQALALALGVTARVKSPTYTVMQEYTVSTHPSIKQFIHADLYRFSSETEVRALALDEYRRPDTIVVIEWLNRVPPQAVGATHQLRLVHAGESSREIFWE